MACRWKLGALVFALAQVASGCTLIEAYPLAGESTVDACANHLDDDFDGALDCADVDCRPFCVESTANLCADHLDDDGNGLVDCDDPGCDGHCPERSVAACGDGRDQDGDGTVDLADPSCWPEATTSRTRCISLAAGAWTAALDGTDPWLVQEGTAASAPDTTGRYTHDVLTLTGMTTVDSAVAVTGGLDGAELTTSFYYGGSTIWFGVVSTAVPPPGAPASVIVELASGGVGITTVTDGMPFGISDGSMHLTRSGWIDATIRFTADRASVQLMDASGALLGSIETSFSTPLSYASALRFRIASRFGTRLGAASFSRPAVRPCDVEIPSSSAPAVSEGVPVASASSGDALCVVTMATNGPVLRSQRSTDGGRTFEPPNDIVASTGRAVVRNPCVSIAYDVERAELVGFVRTFDDQTPARALIVRSADCATWALDDVADPSAWPLCASYSIVGTGPRRVDELWTPAGSPGGLGLVRHWASGPIATDTVLTTDDPVVITGPLVAGAGASVWSFGGDLLVAHQVGGSYGMFVVDRATAEPRAWLTMDPTRIEGACDAASIGPAIFVLDPMEPYAGAVAYSCEARVGHVFPVVDVIRVSNP